ncbi:MAG: V-type ATP synthase subunit A, partial [Bacteroidetes bacterium]|nr:V-type ATP synthase subunit A [Bacteroidota bacterium]
ELPGPDAYPMDLPAIISNFYSRAGYVFLPNGTTGSITFIGAVSPAGGNLKEPVTESTKKAARCFYALSQQRADSKRYPAVDPIDSYSKYLEYPEFIEYLKENVSPNWLEDILYAKNVLVRGKEAYEQINILGDDGVPLEYHLRFWKSEVFDYVILQQDAFDHTDSSTPIERQKYMMKIVIDIMKGQYDFDSFDEVNIYFRRLINVLKQMNYSEYMSDDFKKFEVELKAILEERIVAVTA